MWWIVGGVLVVLVWIRFIYVVLRNRETEMRFTGEWWADRKRREANHSKTVEGPTWNWDEVKKHDGWKKR